MTNSACTYHSYNPFYATRRALEAKAALYDKLSRGEGLKELNRMEDDGEMTGEEGPVYMVDFTKKVYNVSKYWCVKGI